MKGPLRKNSIIANVTYFSKASNFYVSNHEVLNLTVKRYFYWSIIAKLYDCIDQVPKGFFKTNFLFFLLPIRDYLLSNVINCLFFIWPILEARAKICQWKGSLFWRFEDTKKIFWDQLTFRRLSQYSYLKRKCSSWSLA